METSFSKKIIRNTVFNILGRFWGLLIILILTPYIVTRLGIEKFGIWVLVEALISQFGLIDFGFTSSFVKYIAEYDAQHDSQKISRVINSGFVCYLILAIVIIAGGFIFIGYFLRFLNIPVHLQAETRFAFLLGVIIFAVSQIFSSFSALQPGLQRFDIANKITIVLSIPQIIGTIIFLNLGYGIIGLIINTAIIRIVTIIVNLIVAFKILPALRFDPFLFTPEMFKTIFKMGYKIQITTIADWIQGQMNKFLLAYFVTIDSVSYFTPPSNLAARLKEIPIWLASALFPAASELEAQTKNRALSRIYFYAMKYTVLVLLPLTASIVLLAHPFINLWLGKEFQKSSLTLQLLAVGSFFNALTAPAFFILNGIGKPKYAMISAIIAVIVNLLVSISLVKEIGYLGVVIGAACSFTVSAIYFIIMANRQMNVSTMELLNKTVLKPLVVCLALFSIGNLLVIRIEPFTWTSLLGVGLLFLLLAELAILALRHLDDFDKAMLKQIFSQLDYGKHRR